MNEAAVIVFARLGLGFLFSSLIGWYACQRGSLAPSGAVGAVLTGTLIFGLGGVAGGVLLVAFFVTSSALSHYMAVRKQVAAQHFDKGSRRDLGQALANGGAATALAACSGTAWLAGLPPAVSLVCFAALVGALASANADTWATELGVLSGSPPRLIKSPARVVEPGTSGGVTVDGSLAAAAGALLIGLVNLVIALLAGALGAGRVAWLTLYNVPVSLASGLAPALAVFALAGGVVGAMADSLLGATVQASYYSARRDKVTERRREGDGTPNRLLKGWPWLNNDWVNFLASLTGAALAGAASAAALSLAVLPLTALPVAALPVAALPVAALPR